MLFDPSCRYRCRCQDGVVTCLDRCRHERQTPSNLTCPNARLVKTEDRCCARWVCNANRVRNMSAMPGKRGEAWEMGCTRKRKTESFSFVALKITVCFNALFISFWLSLSCWCDGWKRLWVNWLWIWWGMKGLSLKSVTCLGQFAFTLIWFLDFFISNSFPLSIHFSCGLVLQTKAKRRTCQKYLSITINSGYNKQGFNEHMVIACICLITTKMCLALNFPRL